MINSIAANEKPVFSMVSIDSIAPSAQNARTHSEAQIKKIAESIHAFGFLNPIIVSKDGTVIAGHCRLESAKLLGLTEVPVVRADHLTDTQRRAYMLTDNRTALDAGYDEEILSAELRDLFAAEFDMGLTGFDNDELTKFLNQTAALTDEDEVPEPPSTPVTRPGDTWLLGAHRLRCGDSTSPDDVKALLAGAVPNLMSTDPPYGVEYDVDFRNGIKRADGSIVSARAVGKVLNDDRADWREAWALFPGDVAYVWCASLHSHEVAESLIASSFDLRAQIIWNKNQMAIGRGNYHWKHEPCWYAVREGKTANWQGSRKETTVWDIDKPQKSETGHSTQKPVECMRRPMQNNAMAGDIVYDPFLGSSISIIAAELESIICYGMELSPEYCDVGVVRWQNFTGKQATRESDGVLFDDLARETIVEVAA